MVSVNNRRTDAELVFATAVAAHGDPTEAARRAGYSQPSRDAGRLMARPGVQAEIARIQTERLYGEALPAAINCLIGIITSDKAAAGARVQAAKVVLDRTLGADGATVREPHEMSPDELARALSALETVAASRAKDVTPAPAEPDPFA